jgi:hypothetical protein
VVGVLHCVRARRMHSEFGAAFCGHSRFVASVQHAIATGGAVSSSPPPHSARRSSACRRVSHRRSAHSIHSDRCDCPCSHIEIARSGLQVSRGQDWQLLRQAHPTLFGAGRCSCHTRHHLFSASDALYIRQLLDCPSVSQVFALPQRVCDVSRSEGGRVVRLLAMPVAGLQLFQSLSCSGCTFCLGCADACVCHADTRHAVTVLMLLICPPQSTRPVHSKCSRSVSRVRPFRHPQVWPAQPSAVLGGDCAFQFGRESTRGVCAFDFCFRLAV